MEHCDKKRMSKMAKIHMLSDSAHEEVERHKRIRKNTLGSKKKKSKLSKRKTWRKRY